MGAKIGEGVKISPFSVVVAKKIKMDPVAAIKPFSLINAGELEMGAYSVISNFCIVNGIAKLKIGPRSLITVGSLIDLHADVTIGEYSAIGPRNNVMTHGIFYPSSWGFKHILKPVKIGDFVWTNNNCKIAAGVIIGSRTMVLPNSVIRTDINSDTFLFDDSFNRKCFPFCFLRSNLNTEEKQQYIEEFAIDALSNVMGVTRVDIQDKRISLPDRDLQIFLNSIEWEQQEKGWVWGYDIPEAIMLGRTKLEALDFSSLLYSVNASRLLKNVADYSRTNWGNRFADYKHKDYFKYGRQYVF